MKKNQKMQVIPIVEKKDITLQIYPDYYDFNVDEIRYTVETLKNHFVVNKTCLDAIDAVLRTFKSIFDTIKVFNKDGLLSLIENKSWITEFARVSYLDGDYSDNELIDYFNFVEYYGNKLLKEANLFGDFVITFDRENMFDHNNAILIYSKEQYINFLNETTADYGDGNLNFELFSEFVKKENLTVEDFQDFDSVEFDENLNNEDNLVCIDMVFVK